MILLIVGLLYLAVA